MRIMPYSGTIIVVTFDIVTTGREGRIDLLHLKVFDNGFHTE